MLGSSPASLIKEDAMRDVWDDNSLNLDGSRVIDRRIYLEPSVYQAEQELIFARTWQWVGHESEIPEAGDYVTATVAGRPVVISRTHEGAVAAFLNTCTHRGAMLAPHARGKAPNGFTCMYHAWCFGNDGAFEGAALPAAYGENLEKGCYDAPKVRSDVFAGSIFVTLSDEAVPLADYLGEAGSYIQRFTGAHEVIGRVRWSLEGNWKLWHENFRDNYHPMFTHQLLNANYQGVKIEGVNLDLADGHSLLAFPSQGNPDGIRQRIRRLTGMEPQPTNFRRRPAPDGGLNHFIMAIFPNLDFQFSVGGEMGNYVQTVRPIGIGRSVVELTAFGTVGEPEEARRARLDGCLDGQTAAGKISGDDNEAARRCTTGFGAVAGVPWSNMDRGQAPGVEGGKNDEYSLRAFYREYKKYMGDSLRLAA
jgi:phenylpropionate dioxygenase-like ring-hydroxylating dioxygenase large terminal subunit